MWNGQFAEETVRQIVGSSLRGFSQKMFWPMPEDEGWGDQTPTSIYDGAMGVLWALDYLQQYAEEEFPFDQQEIAGAIHQRYFVREVPAFSKKSYPSNIMSSYFKGETGILLVKSKIVPSQSEEIWDKQFSLIQDNIENPTLEPHWGGTGSMIPALFSLEQSATARWHELFVAQCQFMKGTIVRDETFDCPIWVQDLYEKKERMTGAGHGFVGNMYPFIRGSRFLPSALADWVINDSIEMAIKTAKVEGECCNWPTVLHTFDLDRHQFLLQWCHGAPGVIASLNGIPKGYSQEFDGLLVGAGETIWQAGPLKKKASLCHGTDGNGFALLKLYKRTGDGVWLERARAFAIHAIDQSRNRFSLWNGDLGLACFLHACLVEDDRLPLIDVY